MEGNVGIQLIINACYSDDSHLYINFRKMFREDMK